MLYDRHRSLFSIGYNLSEGRLDASYYDLLASECRLASFLAVAKGDVDQEHWFRLGRSLTATREGRALVSWSASMFEYLMPLLVMQRLARAPCSTETYETVVRRQIAYGRERGVPWGVSESAFNAKDAQLTYQYQAFGVPGLGLKRGLSDDVVVAPYASVLALPIDPRSGRREPARRSPSEGAEGTLRLLRVARLHPRARARPGPSRAVVKSYFAHHQGMAFVALANAVAARRMQRPLPSRPDGRLGGAAAAGARAARTSSSSRRTSRRCARSARCASCRRRSPAPTRPPTRPFPRRTSCPTAATR